VTRTFWLSFCDTDLPASQQFLGACLVEVTDAEAATARKIVAAKYPLAKKDAEWIAAASRKAHAMKCNPGGEMLSIDVTGHPNLAKFPRHRLLSRADIEALDGPAVQLDSNGCEVQAVRAKEKR